MRRAGKQGSKPARWVETIQNAAPELPRMRLPRNRVNKVYAYDFGLLVEDVLDLPERVGREDVSESQVRCPRVRQGMEDVAWYEDS